MNLLENEEINNNNKKTKTIMTIIIVMIVLLLILSLGILYLMYDIQKNTLKLNIDGVSKNFSSDMFLFEEDDIYVSIKDFAKLIGYEAYNGDHRSEDTTKCYIKNSNEEASFELNSNKIYKTLLSGNDNEYFNIEKPVKMHNNKLYVVMKGMQIGGNCAIGYDESNKQLTVYTLPFLTTHYTSQFANSAIADEKADYSNKKALLYNMIVVANEDKKYGVYSLEKQEIIGTKYISIKFVESSQEFLVTADDGKMGIMSSDGTTKIQPVYDEIKQIDKDLKLYLVENNRKQGVINQNGNIVVYLEFDKIGVDTTQFASNEIKNQYLLFDNCIPVQRDKKWGLYDKTGKQITQIKYDELGCVAGTQSNKSSNNLLIIPKYEGIVVREDKKYGVINSVGKELVPSVLDSIYSITTAGQDSFYMIQGEKTIDLIDYIERFVLKTDTNQNTNTNTTNTDNTNQNNIKQTNTTTNNDTSNEITNTEQTSTESANTVN